MCGQPTIDIGPVTEREREFVGDAWKRIANETITDPCPHPPHTSTSTTPIQPKTSPNALEPATTVLSPYLKHGAVSPKLFYHELQAVSEQLCVSVTRPD